MMICCELVIPGVPTPQKRPRFAKRSGRVYNPNSTEMLIFRGQLIKSLNSHLLSENCEIENKALYIDFDSVLFVTIDYHLPIPKTLTKRVKMRLNNGGWHSSKPDVDNLVKFTLDSCVGVLFPDDSQIAKMVCCKSYSENPKTIIKVEKLL